VTKVERGLREFLSAWQTWMVLAFFGLAAVSVYSIHLSDRQARDEAARLAAANAAASTQVGQCFTAVENSPVIVGFIDAHESIIENGLISNRQALNAVPEGPLRMVRERSLVRLRAAKKNADKLRALIVKTTPTRKKCLRIAHRLGVDPSRYTHS
jgi:ornithine cyclodeaminase/alanine dehydrogenase-like protein (mu-crystallin family)